MKRIIEISKRVLLNSIWWITWYSVGPVCTESGVESFGGVGGNENKCWPDWWLCTWTLSCGSCGQANGLPQGLPDANDLGSLNHGCRGAWKCGLHTWGDACDEDIREAENFTNKIPVINLWHRKHIFLHFM